MNESEKQFSFSRAALSTCGRAKSKFLSLQSRRLPVRDGGTLPLHCPGTVPRRLTNRETGQARVPGGGHGHLGGQR